jgi:uncharacterized protein
MDEGLQALLALQEKDVEIDQAHFRRENLEERAQMEAAMQNAGTLKAELDSATSERDATAASQATLEAKVASIESRISEINRRLYGSDTPAPKDAESMSTEISHLKDQQSELEDQELALMEALEPQQARVSALEDQARQLAADAAGIKTRLTAAEEALGLEIAELHRQREGLAANVPQSLIARYDALRPKLGGVAVARLEGRRCGGCHLELAAMEINRLRNADDGTVVTCEDCGRILVLTE